MLNQFLYEDKGLLVINKPSGYDRFTRAWFAELLRLFQGNLAGRVVKITSR
jgi:hypothetical protein